MKNAHKVAICVATISSAMALEGLRLHSAAADGSELVPREHLALALRYMSQADRDPSWTDTGAKLVVTGKSLIENRLSPAGKALSAAGKALSASGKALSPPTTALPGEEKGASSAEVRLACQQGTCRGVGCIAKRGRQVARPGGRRTFAA